MNFYIQDTLEIFLKMPKMTALRNTFLLGLHRQVDPCEFEASLGYKTSSRTGCYTETLSQKTKVLKSSRLVCSLVTN